MDARHPTEQAPKSDLSIQELETLLLARRRQVAVRALREVSLAEDEVRRTQSSRRERLGTDHADVLPAVAPETWRGAEGQDRYFRSLTLTPLSSEALLTAESAGHGAFSADRDRERPRRGAWLLAVEVLALVAFLVILGASFRQLRTLNIEARTAQAVRLNAVPIAKDTAHASTPSPEQETQPVVAVMPAATTIDLAVATRVFIPAVISAEQVTRTMASSATTMPVQAVDRPLLATPVPSPMATRPALLPGGDGPVETSEADENPATATPTVLAPSPEGMGLPLRMVIPAIEVDAPIVMGDTWEDLKKGIGHRPGSAMPGEPNNMVVSAHNDVYGEIFRRLPELEPGDEVTIYTDLGAYRYAVVRVEIVLPTQVEVMDPTDHAVLTMISCYPYLLDTHRVVAVAEWIQE